MPAHPDEVRLWERKERMMALQKEWNVGDVIVVEAMHHAAEGRLGQGRRVGEILAVFGEPSRPHFRVRWDDGHETIYYPGHDSDLRRPA